MGWVRSLFGIPDAAAVVPAEGRAVTSVPWTDDHTPFNMVPAFPSGNAVSPELALSLGSVYAAVRLLATSISTLPLKGYRRGSGGERVPMTGSLPPLFQQLIDSGEIVPWLHRLVVSAALRGNAYGLVIARDGFGFPTQVEWLNPSRVFPDDRPGRGRGWLYDGREIPGENIVHIPWFAMPGERVGLSPIRAYAHTLGVGLQAQTYASDWFGAGGFPPGTFRNEQKIVNPSEADAIKARLVAAIRSHSPLVHGSDWKYEPITVPPEEAQFVETMKMTTNQIAAVYGISPEMIGGDSGTSLTYKTLEQDQIKFVMFTLRPWLVLLESVFSSLLPDRQYVRFNSDALVRADLRTRWEVNRIRLEVGAASVDEIRAQEDESPLPNGQGQSYGPVAPVPAPSSPGDVTPMRRVQ